ncbi:hypothetical protein [Pseudoalteromonas sp. MMG022]|uniref:hypothetical protein n=1 Tax=Pseudoalteromonas sp. MMG022 TaxID=2909978 RepID=UPI001F1B1F82|nr:hypothetical protein [Pseudoalteromonas sp. MMG022]MCF6436684.1 hypothetical protein [Pseudoalteromonas sp. MMG022]
MKQVFLWAAILTLTSGCIFHPKEVSYFDERCQTYAKKAVLDSERASLLTSCSGSACGGWLAAEGLVSAASLVISGSIVLVQNAVYWQEKNKNCNAQSRNAEQNKASKTSEEKAQSNLTEIERIE